MQGLGAGGLLPLAQTAIADLFSPRDRGRYQGLIGAMWAIAAIAGPLLGGTLTDAASWRWIFWLNLPLGVIALVVVMKTMRVHQERREHTVDVAGAITLSVAVVCVLLACSWGGSRYPWISPEVLGVGVVGVLAFVAFLRIAGRAPEPLLPLSLFRGRVFSVSSMASVTFGAMMFAVTIYVPVYVQGAQGRSATASGFALIPLLLTWTVMSFVCGQIISRTGRYRAFPIVGSLFVILGAVLLSLLDADSSAVDVAIAVAVVGIGMGTMVQTYIIATQNAVDTSVVGTATAALQFFRSMGGSLAVAGPGRAPGRAPVDRAEHAAGRRGVGDRPGPSARGQRRDPVRARRGDAGRAGRRAALGLPRAHPDRGARARVRAAPGGAPAADGRRARVGR